MYQMCDILSRKRAFQENIYNIDRQISLDLVSNVHRAKELGKFDETRFIGLLTTDPLALPVLEATLFACRLERGCTYVYNMPVPTDAHALHEVDADCLRLAAAKLLRYVPDATRTLSDAIDDLACHPRAYRMSLPER